MGFLSASIRGAIRPLHPVASASQGPHVDEGAVLLDSGTRSARAALFLCAALKNKYLKTTGSPPRPPAPQDYAQQFIESVRSRRIRHTPLGVCLNKCEGAVLWAGHSRVPPVWYLGDQLLPPPVRQRHSSPSLAGAVFVWVISSSVRTQTCHAHANHTGSTTAGKLIVGQWTCGQGNGIGSTQTRLHWSLGAPTSSHP